MDFLGLFVECACNPTPPNNIGLWFKKFCLHEVQGLDQECSESLEVGEILKE